MNSNRITTDGLRLLGWALGLLLLAMPVTLQAQFEYTTEGGRVTITGYTGPGGDVAISDTIDGLPVTSIGEWAFNECTSLTSIVIPDSVTRIGDEAFGNCTNLTSVVIGNSDVMLDSDLCANDRLMTHLGGGKGVTLQRKE